MRTSRTETSPRSLAALLTGTLLAALTALLLGGCGGDDGADPTASAVPTGVAKEDAKRVSGTIGPSGGTLQATASDGTRYTLTIPPNALPSAREIAMTPVTAIGGYPLAGGVAAGVEFEPSGTVFAVPASLAIETVQAAPAGSVAVAILCADDGKAFRRSFLGQGAGTYTVPVQHFSGATVGFATAPELAALVNLAAADCLLNAIEQASRNDLPALFATYRSCFASDVLPALEAATDDVTLATAIGKFVMWKEYSRQALGPERFATFDDSAETSQYAGVLVGKLQAAIDRNNQKCRADQSIAALVNVLFWQTQAERFEVDSVANRLDRQTVERELCARLVIASLTLADPLQSTVPSDLDANFELLFEGRTAGQAVPVQVGFSGTNATFGKASPANSNLQGDFTLAVGAQTASQRVVVQLRGCLVVDGQIVPGVCAGQTIERNGSAATELGPGTRWAGTVDYEYVFSESTASGGLGRMGYSMPGTATLSDSYSNQIRMALNTTIDTRTFPATGVVTGAYTVSTSAAASTTGQLGPVGTIPACQVRYDGSASRQVQATVSATNVGNVGWAGGTVNLLPPTYSATGTATDTFQYSLTHIEPCIYFGSGPVENQSNSSPVTISNFVAPDIASGLVPNGTTLAGSVTKTWDLSAPNAPTALTNAYGKNGSFTATVTYNLRVAQ